MEIKCSEMPVAYEDALSLMEQRVAAIRAGAAPELLWLLEHPPLYTAGTSARGEDLLDPRFPVYQAGRGGQYTYHGPGQRVAYVMRDLKAAPGGPDVRRYVWQLEEWIIRSLAKLGVESGRRDGRVGIWVATPAGDEKIAAIGVRVRRWVTYHGIAINVDPDLSHFTGIVPCGLAQFGVTSLEKLGTGADMAALDAALLACRDEVFALTMAQDAAA